MSASPASTGARTIAPRFRSPANARALPQSEQLEPPLCSPQVGVLVEHAFARPAPELLCVTGIRQQIAIGGYGLVRVVHDDELASRLEPAFDPLVRVRDDRRAAGGELEWTTGRRGGDRRMGSPRDVEVDPRRRDRAREDVERNVTEQPCTADVPAEVAAAEREVEVAQPVARLADERRHPLPPELVAIAVEEDV